MTDGKNDLLHWALPFYTAGMLHGFVVIGLLLGTIGGPLHAATAMHAMRSDDKAHAMHAMADHGNAVDPYAAECVKHCLSQAREGMGQGAALIQQPVMGVIPAATHERWATVPVRIGLPTHGTSPPLAFSVRTTVLML